MKAAAPDRRQHHATHVCRFRQAGHGTADIMVKDDKGGFSDITITDVNQSNGAIHVIDHVLMPAA